MQAGGQASSSRQAGKAEWFDASEHRQFFTRKWLAALKSRDVLVIMSDLEWKSVKQIKMFAICEKARGNKEACICSLLEEELPEASSRMLPAS